MGAGDNQQLFKSGNTILRQDEDGDCAHIIEEERVNIEIEKSNGAKQHVGTRDPGTMIGEIALIDNAPRTATVTALEDCKVLKIINADFSRRLKAADPVLRMSAQVILTRYRDMLLRADITGENKSWPPVEAVEVEYARC